MPPEYTAADGILGGTAYSKWYITASGGMDGLDAYGLTVDSDFVRCKACHAWDGQGNAGSYATRDGVSTLNDGRPDVSSFNLRSTIVRMSIDELYDLIARPSGRTMAAEDSRHPDFTAFLTDEQIWNLIKFMREEWIDPNDLYDLEVQGPTMHIDPDTGLLVKPTLVFSDIGKDGDAANGAIVMANVQPVGCLSGGCHGADGTSIDLDGNSLGSFARNKPYELWHKAKFGEPPAMAPGLVTATSDIKDMYKELSNEAKYPDLP